MSDELDRLRARQARKRNFKDTAKIEDEELDIFELDEGYEDDTDEEYYQAPPKKRRARMKKKRRKKKRIRKLILILFVLVCGVMLYQHMRDDGYWTVAVFGVDSRDGNVGKGALADVIMVSSINKKTGEIRIVSVFRDSYLNIGNDQYHKINEAYSRGGYSQAITALEDNLDIKIDDYATFNWKAVAEAINVLGGIDLEISDSEFAYINSFITETVKHTDIGSVHLEHSGSNHLDGVQAVAYARLRLMDTDFNRTQRQRKVIGLAMEKAKQADFNTLRILVGTVFPEISTSIGVDDLLSLAKNTKKYYLGQTSGFPFSHSEMHIDKRSVVIPTTLESNVIMLHEFLYDKDRYTPSANNLRISAHIIKVSGLDEPGKDTESGKNIGVNEQSTNTAQPTKAAASKPTATQNTTPAIDADPVESSEVLESESEEVPTIESLESIETTEAEETSSETTGEIVAETTGQTVPSPGDGADQTEAPGPGNTTPNEKPSNSLEGPGQEHNSINQEAGPGAA